MDDQDQQGITAYHGSPHDFEQFDTSKIGTGEGAQVYGHGLYFAEHEPVAKKYRDDLAGQNVYMIDHVLKHAPEMQNVGQKTLHDIIMCSQTPEWDPHTAAQWAQYTNTDLRNFDTAKIANAIASYRNAARGHMYEVHIKAHPHHFLDWDRPLSEQSEHVRKTLTKLARSNDSLMSKIQDIHSKNANADQLYGALTEHAVREKKYEGMRNGMPEKDAMPSLEFGQKFASDILMNHGIKGIRYLDAGSRGKDEKPTHNYVVFDHNDVHIKRKYEQGGRVDFGDGGSVHDKFLPHNHPQRLQNLGEFMKDSVVKHPNGAPKVVYHNTDREFRGKEFDTDSRELGSHFGSPAQANDITVTKSLDGEEKPHHGFPVYLNIKNPLRLQDRGGFDNGSIIEQLEEKGLIGPVKSWSFQDQMRSLRKSEVLKNIQNHIKSMGYDGVVYLNRREGFTRPQGKLPVDYDEHTDQQFLHHFPDAHDSYIAFDPHQIKSAIGNNGYFDPNSPRIDEHAGGRIGFDIGGAVPETPTLAGVQSFFDQANLVNQAKDAAAGQDAYQQALANQNKAKEDAGIKDQKDEPIAKSFAPMGSGSESSSSPVANAPDFALGMGPPAPSVGFTNPISAAIDNPLGAATNTGFGLAMGALGPVGMALGAANTVSGLFGGPTVASMMGIGTQSSAPTASQSQAPSTSMSSPAAPSAPAAPGAMNTNLGMNQSDLGVMAASIDAQNAAAASQQAAEQSSASTTQGSSVEGVTSGTTESGTQGGSGLSDPSGGPPGGFGEFGGVSSEWRGGRIHRNTGGPINVSKAKDTAGNFKKEHEKIHGIPVAIEVKKGHERVKYKPGGKIKFKAKQYADYGAILGTKDADGMNTDVMVGPHKGSDKAYIIDQQKHDSGKFDEHKVLLGFKKRKKAIKAYTKSYADRHGKERVKDVVKTDIKGLKKWLKYGNLDKPASKDALIKTALSVVSKKT